jgi:hypothetical protein
MDTDLDTMSRDQLIAEVKKLRHGIRAHRDTSLHELCWHHPALWNLLPEKTDPLLPCRSGRSSCAAASSTASPWSGRFAAEP